MKPSFWLALLGMGETFAISLPTVVDAFRGTVTVERCDERLRRWAKRLLDQADVRRTVVHAERVRGSETFVVMSNHRSLYDVPLLFDTFPHTLRMIAKSELFRVPIWGPAMREAGFIEIDRKNSVRAKQNLQVAKARLAAGINVWIAPEGTRSRSGQLGEFKSGGFRLAAEAGHRILPVALLGTEKILPPTGARVSRGASVEVNFGHPIDPSHYQGGRRRALIEDVRGAILTMLEEGPARAMAIAE
jgi:1-acyl-sn-glycerol-3-phosphate acyltransferase